MNGENKVEHDHSSSERELEYLKQLGDRLQYVREKIANCSQSDFGNHLNTGRSSVIRYENGERPCNAIYLHRICSKWGISPIWIQDGIGGPLDSVGGIKEGEASHQVDALDYDQLLDNVYQAVFELETVLKNNNLTIDNPRNKAKLIAMCVDHLYKRPVDASEPVSAQILRFIKFGT